MESKLKLIGVEETVKKELDRGKLVNSETYNSVVKRLLKLTKGLTDNGRK